MCNSNRAVVGLVISAKALIQKFGPIETVSMVTMQAFSGAGYPGVSSRHRLTVYTILHITPN